MKIAFNPSTVAALTTPPNNKDITFDLRGRNIFARGVKFLGTDTNTWRDIKINNVSIGSNILDLRNGSNTTLTNINGVVTINSTLRPVVDNLTSNSTTSSLSANLGRILKALIDGKSDSDHNHDGRYLRLDGSDTMQGNLYLHSYGTSYIGRGSGDKSGADFTEANIVIRSWWGISFKSNDDIVRTYIDTRTGNIGTKGVLNAVGAVIQGRVYNGGDDEGIIVKPSPNGYAGLILGAHNGERSVFYFTKGNPFWRYNNGSTNLDILHPKKSGTIALTSDIPSSLKNPYSLTTFGVVYDGSAAKVVDPSNFISLVTEGTSTITDGTMFITSYASNSGFADTNAVNVPYKRKAIHLWEYIKAKTDSLYATKGHNHDDRYVRAFGTSNDNIDSDWGLSFKTFDPIPSGTPPELNPNISLLSIGNNFNRRKLLAFIYNNDNIYYRRHVDNGFTNWRRLAFANEIPTSLKNPHALTISLNGTSQGPYDGSSAKNINITPSSIGAAVSNHSHDYLVVNAADDKSFNSAYHNFLVLYAGGGNGITGKPANVDAFGLFKFRTASGWSGQMLLSNGGSLYIRSSEDAKITNTLAWKTILDSSNYSGILDSRYYTESEVNNLLSRKLDRVNLTTGSWNPRGYNLAADYNYNGGDLSISENSGKMYVSIDGLFYQNEGLYRVLDTSDIGSIHGSLTLYQYLSSTDTNWFPLVWGGSDHKNTSNSTGSLYKSYDKLSWLTSSLTLHATNIQTENIKHLSIGGGIYWNPYVESTTDGSDAASITLVRLGVAGGTTLVLSLMNDANDTILFKTNGSARLYHNSYPILTTLNTYVSNNKGYINGAEITLVNNSDKVDNRHAISTTPNTGIIYKAAIYTSSSLTSYWVRLASIPSISLNGEFVATIHVLSGHSNPGRSAILLVYLRGNASSFMSKSFKICCNSNYDPNRFRLYYKDSDKTSEIWYQTTGLWDGIITTVISLSSEGSLYEGLTLYSGSITAVQTPSMSTYLSALVSTITDNISGNAATATKLLTARSLWGNMFDGTGNVSGFMKNVTGLIHGNNIGDDWSDGNNTHPWYGIDYRHCVDSAETGKAYTSISSYFGLYFKTGGSRFIFDGGNVGIGTNAPTQRLDVRGNTTITGFIAASSAFINTGDSTLKVYSGRITDAKSDGNICLQTSIDGTDGQSHAYPTQYGARCNLVLLPRGGQVYIGTNPDGGNTTYKLYVNSKIFSNGGFVKNGSSDSYVLLGGGGHKLESSLRVAYASNADMVDGYHATDGRTFTGNINWSPNWNDAWSDGTNKHPWYGFDHRYPNTGAYSTTISDFFGMTIKTANTLRLDFGTLLLNGTNIYSINVASATKLQTARSIWGHSFNGTADVNGTIYINNSDSSNGAIRLNNNVNSNARISAISDQVIFNTGNAIRFGETSWDWNVWAGLKYTHSNKTIYLGIADGSVFNANSALSGGSLRFPGISNVYATTFNGSLSGNASTATNADKIDGVHLNGIFTAFGNNAHNITATIGGVTKSFLVNWAADSDKLDGYHENSFLRYRGDTSTDLEATLWSLIGIKLYNNALPDNLTGVYNYGSVISLPGSSSRFEIYASHLSSNGNGLYYRSGWGSDKKSWLKFIDSSNIGSQSVNYANSAGNADKLDGIHANGLLTALSNSNNGISITVGGTTKSVSNISVNYASSAGSATKVIVNLHTTNDTNYPLVWSNLSNTNSVTENQLYKSWSDLYYNPKNKRLTVGGSVVASSFVKRGGTSLQLLRADGGIAAFNWSGQSGLPSWLWGGNNEHSYYVYNPSNFRVAYATSAGSADTALYLRSLGNLNCQTGRTLNYGDVYTYNTYANNTGAPTSYTSVIGFGRGIAGTVEIAGGWDNTNLYWRSLRDCCEDWHSWRTVLDSSNYTEYINNYYWANVKISASSSTTTSPTVSNLTATSSIRMGNIYLLNTNEINSASGIHLNYQNSGNISLCYGGGKVGIGTTSPTYKLDVNGLMRASGFHHSSMNSDNYILLAGGGYKSFGGDSSHPVFLGYLNLDHGSDGTVSSSFYCLGYSVSFTYTRGGNYCKISIPDTTHQAFYIKAATASVNYSGGGMDTWTGNHRGAGAWWLHCYASSSNEVRVKGFHLKDTNNDSWWGGNPLWSDRSGVNRITVCIFGYVTFR